MKQFEEFMKMNTLDKSEHTVRSYQKHIERFMFTLNISSVEDISVLKVGDIRTYFNSRKEGGLKESSVNAEIRVVKTFLNWLLENGHIKKNPIVGLKFMKEPKTIAIMLTDEERNAMITSCKNLKMKLMVAMLFYLGIRREEITKVKVEDFVDGKLRIKGKGRKERILAVHPYVLSLMDKYLKHRNDDYEYLFGTRIGFGGLGSGEWHPITVAAVRNAVKRSAELAGIDPERIDKISPHVLRKSFACSLAANNVGSFAIQKALGHSSITTTERYLAPANASISDSALLAQESPE